jgi:mannosyltransferase
MEHAAPGYSRVRSYTAAAVNVAVIVAAISGLALVLRLLYLGQHSFWSDEILSVQRASGDWFEGGTHMVAYHTLLHIWLVLGDSEIIVRSLSVIFAVATIPVVYLLGARLFGSVTGLVASFLLAINSYHIQYAQEARSYSLLTLLASVSSLFFMLGIEKRSRLIWAAYVITSALTVYAHIFGAIVLLAQAASLLFLHWRKIPWKWMLSAWVATGLLLDFVIRGAIGTALEQVADETAEGGGGIEWIEAPTLQSIKGTLAVLAGNGVDERGDILLAAYAVPVVIALIIAVAIWASSLKRLTHRKSDCTCSRCTEIRTAQPSSETPLSWRFAFLFSWFLLPFVVLLAASLISPVFVPRYTLASLPALVIIAAVGITYTFRFIRNRLSVTQRAIASVAMGAVLLVILGLSARGINSYYTEFEKEDWRGAALLITSRWQPGDGILFYMPWMEGKFRFYLDRLDLQLPPSAYIVPQSEWRDFIVDGEMGENPDSQVIAQYLPAEEYGRVWLVLAHHGSSSRTEVSHELRAALQTVYPSENIITLDKVRVLLYRQAAVKSPID